ncbi:MAG TPA: BrnT family toxin [Candidatus Kapabacteria bacterium]
MTLEPDRHLQIAPLVAECTSFEWDAGNKDKSWKKHRVSDAEAEEIFGNVPLQFSDDPKHSTSETRYAVLGKTDGNRLLSVVLP